VFPPPSPDPDVAGVASAMMIWRASGPAGFFTNYFNRAAETEIDFPDVIAGQAA